MAKDFSAARWEGRLVRWQIRKGQAMTHPATSTGKPHAESRFDETRVSRRQVLGMLTAVGVSLALAPHSFAQSAASGPRIIDTHHHIFPPNFTKWNLKRMTDDSPTFPGSFYTNWSPQYSLDQMDKNGVATAIGSMTSPGVWFGDSAEGRRNARDCNEYGAKLVQDHPGRFGMWGAIPLPDTEGSLREIEYVYDTLKLDGIGLLTSYDDGKLLGHPNFSPVLEELDRRKAIIFVHPTISCCGMPIRHVNRVQIDFPTDTTRTITDLIYSESLMRFPNIRWIFSHGGGTVLMLTPRLAGAGLSPEERAAVIPNGFEHELQKLYYDVASVALSPVPMAAVFKAIPMEHLLFGSDIPFFTIERIAAATDKFEISAADLRKIQRENALELLPRLKTKETA
jgi:predicted TIM-barrel fold metal-dependent hydrolase